MKTSGIFTRRASGLDRRVWFTMIVTILLSFALVSYKMVTGKKETACASPLIFVNGIKDDGSKTYIAGERLWFKTPIGTGGNATWDFGDSAKQIQGFNAAHIYTRKGIFQVSVTLEGGCIARTKLVVIEPLPAVDSAGHVIEHILGSDQVAPGKYTFSTPDIANTYKWAIENDNNFQPQFAKEGMYTFRTAGRYTLKLTLNNDRNKTFRKEILVVDVSDRKNDRLAGRNHDADDLPLVIPNSAPSSAPIQSQVTPIDTPKTIAPVIVPKAPPIIGTSSLTFKSYLQSLVCGDMDVKDLYKYLADKGATKVIANKAYTTLDAFCKEIKGKKLEIESVEFKKEGDRITEINVGYDKKGRLARNPCKG